MLVFIGTNSVNVQYMPFVLLMLLYVMSFVRHSVKDLFIYFLTYLLTIISDVVLSEQCTPKKIEKWALNSTVFLI